jgi:hypothetical protein
MAFSNIATVSPTAPDDSSKNGTSYSLHQIYTFRTIEAYKSGKNYHTALLLPNEGEHGLPSRDPHRLSGRVYERRQTDGLRFCRLSTATFPAIQTWRWDISTTHGMQPGVTHVTI